MTASGGGSSGRGRCWCASCSNTQTNEETSVPIDAEKARGAALPRSEASWGPDQVILYHLGVGAAAANPTAPGELAYTYERGLKVLPSYGVIPVFGATGGMFQVPGLQ